MIPESLQDKRLTDASPHGGSQDHLEQLLERGLLQPAQGFLSRRGKGLRAMLMGHCYRMAGGVGDIPAQAVTVIELLHAGALIVDDIEDRSEFRRGQPTLHRQIGLPLALNTGNWMYFRALEILGELAVERGGIDCLLRWTISTVRECYEGQAIDLAARVYQLDQAAVRPTVEAISRGKTAALTALAARVAAALAGAPDTEQQLLASCGAELGICLQMRNDLDEVYQAGQPGGRCDDLLNGRVTWPWAWVAEQCGHKQFEELQSRAFDAQTDVDAARNIAAILHHHVCHIAAAQISARFRQQFVGPLSWFKQASAIDELQRALQVIVDPHSQAER